MPSGEVGTQALRSSVLAPAGTQAVAGSNVEERPRFRKGWDRAAGLKKGEEAWAALCCRWRRSRRRLPWCLLVGRLQ